MLSSTSSQTSWKVDAVYSSSGEVLAKANSNGEEEALIYDLEA